ncbi:MAG TPA: hypothetical protein VG847_07610 [Chitinophagaceae bacterium]|nr:hypothetical protein [Chitinophagaceae bacterium]
MKKIYIKIATAAVTFLGLLGMPSEVSSQVTQQEDPTSLVQNFTVDIDKLGNAKMVLDQKMNAAQWASFKQSQIYNDPSISRRDIERSMATYDVQDFKRDVDEMNREVKLSMTVNAYAQYNGDGEWTLKIDSKNPQVTKLTDRSYMITGNTLMGAGLVQQIYRINFPSSAGNVKQTTDEFGKAIFTFDSGRSFLSYLKWNNIVGLILILIAVYYVIQASRQRPTFNAAKV